MGDNLGASDIETVTVQLAGLLLTISVSPLQSGDSPPRKPDRVFIIQGC